VRRPEDEAADDGRSADPHLGRWRSIARGLRAGRRFGLLPMVTPVRVVIVGAPVACGPEVKDTWRELSAWVGDQLRSRFGEAVVVEYVDLLDPACPSLPADAALPLVLVDDQVLSSGGKLSVPVIRRAVESHLAPSVAVEERAGSAQAG